MKEWYRNEFISQEFSLAHRVLEEELPFYEAIAKGDLEYVEENIREQEFVNPDG